MSLHSSPPAVRTHESQISGVRAMPVNHPWSCCENKSWNQIFIKLRGTLQLGWGDLPAWISAAAVKTKQLELSREAALMSLLGSVIDDATQPTFTHGDPRETHRPWEKGKHNKTSSEFWSHIDTQTLKLLPQLLIIEKVNVPLFKYSILLSLSSFNCFGHLHTSSMKHSSSQQI